nr:ribosome silencing factor [Gottschalkia acidurici]
MLMDERISIIVKAGDDKKAFDIKALDISGLSTISDYFIILSGNSQRQALSIADEIEDKMHEHGHQLLNKEGHQSGNWILLDYGDILVHVFYKDDREFYDLERLWKDAKSIDVENILN